MVEEEDEEEEDEEDDEDEEEEDEEETHRPDVGVVCSLSPRIGTRLKAASSQEVVFIPAPKHFLAIQVAICPKSDFQSVSFFGGEIRRLARFAAHVA